MEKKGAIACVFVLFFLILLLCVGTGWSNNITYNQCKQGYKQTATPGPPSLLPGDALFRMVWTNLNTYRGEVIIPGYKIYVSPPAKEGRQTTHIRRTGRGVQDTVLFTTKEFNTVPAVDGRRGSSKNEAASDFYGIMRGFRDGLVARGYGAGTGGLNNDISFNFPVDSAVTSQNITGSWRNSAHHGLTRGVKWDSMDFSNPISKGFYQPQEFMAETFYNQYIKSLMLPRTDNTIRSGLQGHKSFFYTSSKSPAGKRISIGQLIGFNNPHIKPQDPHIKPAYETPEAIAVRKVCN